MAQTTLTRRRALALGIAAGAGTMLARAGAATALTRTRGARARGFGLTVRPGDFSGSTSRVLRAPRRFELLGVRGADAVRGRLEVRVRRAGGPWSRWVPLAVRGDHAPDTGTGERASDPVWAGPSDELQLRARRGLRGDLRVHLVSVPAPARRRRQAPVARAAAARQAQPGTPPPIIPRSAWGGDSVPPRAAPAYGVVQLAFVHHTVNANDYTADQSASIVLAIAKYHRDTNGWNDIGYNFVVDQYGQVFEARAGGVEQAVVGAHAQGYNDQSTGIAVLGTYSSVPIPEAAMAAISQLLGWKLSLHGVPCEGSLIVRSGGGSDNRYPAGAPVTLQRISGHRDGDSTSCPGDALYAQLPTLRHRAAALAGPVVAQGQVTLSPAQPDVPYGADAVFTGSVIKPDSTAGVGEPVAVQKRGAKGGWVTIGHTNALSDGSWSLRVPWRRGGAVRARSAGVTSKVATVGITPLLSMRPPARRVRARSLLHVTGRVRPNVPVAVRVEVEGSDGKFRRTGTAAARVHRGHWGASLRLKRPGLYRLTATTKDGAATGTPVLVRATRPRALTGGAAAAG
ncbi:MAG: peptidoglycan recognition protein family protein [Solirubrobacteraceae bacterium]